MFSRLIGTILVVFSVGVVSAQAPKPTAPAKPAFDELFSARVQSVALAAQLANTNCASLDSTKQFNALRSQVQQQFETANPGKTIDWSKLEPIAKQEPKK